MYHVYYLNVYIDSFFTRDEALDFVQYHGNDFGRSPEDYEILDRSDD